jgi:hypothetical protein
MRKARFHFICAFCCGAVATLLTWLLQSQASPIRLPEPLVYLPFLPNAFPLFLSLILSGTVYDHSGTREIIYHVLVFGQWFIVGLGLSFLYGAFRRHHSPA